MDEIQRVWYGVVVDFYTKINLLVLVDTLVLQNILTI